jgi:ribonuclease-3
MNNIKNKLIPKQVIEKIINRYNKPPNFTTVKDTSFYQTAFVQKSFANVDQDNCPSDNYCSINPQHHSASNERLEFLGDKIIDFITTEFLFDSFPDKDEGFLTKLKSRIVKKQSLAFLGEKLGFREYMLISTHVERNQGRENPRFLEDIFESFVGGFYKDQHCDIVLIKKFLLGIYEEFIDLETLINVNDNFKDSILRYFHSKNYGHPVYTPLNSYDNSVVIKQFLSAILVSKETITDPVEYSQASKIHEKLMKSLPEEPMSVLNKSIEGKFVLGIGYGDTKKSSQQDCSKQCLTNLKVSLNY